jgi:CHAD domain-containing protein
MDKQSAIGAAPIPVKQVRRLIERLVSQANHTAKCPNPDAVHDLRVAIRRLDQALVVFKPHLHRKPSKRIRKHLKTLLSAAGEVRNCDIAARILSKTERPGAAALQRKVRDQRKDAQKSLLDRLKQLSLRTQLSKWSNELGLGPTSVDFPAETVKTTARSTLPQHCQRFFEAGEAAASHSSGEKLHEFRIQAKKFRYTLEQFVPVYGSIAEAWIREVRSVQTVLGAMNDYRTVLSMAADAGCRRKLLAFLRNAERRKIRQFRAIWAERFSRHAAASWIQTLRTHGEERPIARKPIASSRASTPRAAAALESPPHPRLSQAG